MTNKAASELAKLSHKKSPRTKEFYQAMSAKGNAAKAKIKEEKKIVDNACARV